MKFKLLQRRRKGGVLKELYYKDYMLRVHTRKNGREKETEEVLASSLRHTFLTYKFNF